MRILGVDPGFANFGWCLADHDGKELVVLNCGVIRTQKDQRKVLVAEDNAKRAVVLAQSLEELLLKMNPINNRAEPEASVICAEAMSHPPHASTAAKMSLAWGVLITVSYLTQIPILQRSPQEIKMAVAGSKKASKIQMKDALSEEFPSLCDPLAAVVGGLQEHCVDALGAVVACLDDPSIKMGLGLEGGSGVVH